METTPETFGHSEPAINYRYSPWIGWWRELCQIFWSCVRPTISHSNALPKILPENPTGVGKLPFNLEALHAPQLTQVEIYRLVDQWNENELVSFWVHRHRTQEDWHPLVDVIPHSDLIEARCREKLLQLDYLNVPLSTRSSF